MPTDSKGAIVVTGTSSGIGEACAIRFSERGHRVFAGVRKESDGAALKQKSASIVPVMIDVTDAVSISAAAASVSEAVGEQGLAGLVNNAGVVLPGPLEFIDLDDLRRQLEVNVIGQIAVTQAFLPLIRKGKGRIVNIGSIGGRVAIPFNGPYNASKFALEALTDSLRQELRQSGIRVAIVEPGAIATRMWDKGLSIADELETKLPQAQKMYGPAIAAVRKASEKSAQGAIPADAVAKVVEHALTSRRPKTRYLVGFEARMGAIMARVVPDRLRDRLVARFMGLPS